MIKTRSQKSREPLQTIVEMNATSQPDKGRLTWKKTKRRLPSPVQLSPQKCSRNTEHAVPVEESSSDSEEMDYEKIREKNLRDNKLFLSTLGMQQAKAALLQTKRSAKSQTRLHREPKAAIVLPRRQSLRLQKRDPDGTALPPVPEPETGVPEHPRLPEGPQDMKKSLVYEDSDEGHSRLAQFIRTRSREDCKTSDNLKFSSMRARKMKVCKDRLFSVALHPSSTKVLAVAGDKWGQLGFWDVESGDAHHPVVYQPHSRPVTHMCIPYHDPQKIYTCSYDSTLRCGDFEAGIFDMIYSVPEENDDLFRNFDFLTHSTVLLSQFLGDVVVVDTRSKSHKADQVFSVCDKYLRSVSVHPLNNNFFVTAGTDLKVCVWDVRMMKRRGSKPLHVLPHTRAPNCAYFSPLTGSHILDTAGDDTINIYSCSDCCGEVKRIKEIPHNNQTGRWLTKFRAVWHPAQETVFFVGSMKRPRRIEAFGINGHLLHEFQDEEVLASVCSVVQYHSSRPVLVGGNSSGYLFVFI